MTGYASSRLLNVCDSMAAADVLIAVTPIFKTSYMGVSKFCFDTLDNDALVGKLVVLAASDRP